MSESSGGDARAWDALTPALSEWILDATSSMGFNRMTPVQASTIPLFMTHKDVVVEAVTGSGKTLAYLIPVIERLLRLDEPIKKHHVGAIILSPTRELATQIHGVLRSLLAFHGPSMAAMKPPDADLEMENGQDRPLEPLYPPSTPKIIPQLLLGGNITTGQDLSRFLKHSPNLLISTPGRLLELLSSPHVHCPQSSFEVLVLDEADRLLDLGFKEDLQKILGRLPKQRRTGLFSASVSEAVGQIIRVGLRNPVKIAVKVRGTTGGEDKRTPARYEEWSTVLVEVLIEISSLQLSYFLAAASHKLPIISKLLVNLDPTPKKTIIYLSTCAAVDYFQHVIPSVLPTTNSQSFSLIPLHGKLPASVRAKHFTRFSNSVTPAILLTTDVAARGLDIPQVDLVMQIDPPSDPKVFIHRCGRAGRAGRKGLSVVLLQPGREEDYLAFLEVRKTPVTLLKSPEIVISDADAKLAANTMRKTVLTDRALHDKAQRGFVSWLKAYSKHQAASIFRVSDLDWEDLGLAWGLLKLPKMPELKKWTGDKSLGLDVDFTAYAYKDKVREQARQQALLEQQQSTGERKKEPRKEPRAWSQKLDVKEERELRREKKRTKREKARWEGMTEKEREEKRELEVLIEEVKKRRVFEEGWEEFEGFD